MNDDLFRQLNWRAQKRYYHMNTIRCRFVSPTVRYCISRRIWAKLCVAIESLIHHLRYIFENKRIDMIHFRLIWKLIWHARAYAKRIRKRRRKRQPTSRIRWYDVSKKNITFICMHFFLWINCFSFFSLIDNLPCATKVEIPDSGETFYDHGYKLGWIDQAGKTYVNNHLDIVLKYHQPTPGGIYRVVGFEVTPKSIAKGNYKFTEKVCAITDGKPQEVVAGENEILWTYSVRWEESEIPWASRWDTYLAMKDVQIHWFSIINSIVVVLCLSGVFNFFDYEWLFFFPGFLSVIIVRTVRRDIANYNKDEDIEETLEETGWKLVHGDVFRPPPNSLLLVILVGTGIQLLGMVVVTVCMFNFYQNRKRFLLFIVFAMLGMLSPASRGSLTSAGLFLYCFMGLISGYFAGRLYKTLRGVQPKRAAFQVLIFTWFD